MQNLHQTARSSGSGNAQLHSGSVANAAVSVFVRPSRSDAVAVRGSCDIARAVSRAADDPTVLAAHRERRPLLRTTARCGAMSWTRADPDALAAVRRAVVVVSRSPSSRSGTRRIRPKDPTGRAHAVAKPLQPLRKLGLDRGICRVRIEALELEGVALQVVQLFFTRVVARV